MRVDRRVSVISLDVDLIEQHVPAFNLLIFVLQALVPMLQAFSFGCDTKLAASCISCNRYIYISYIWSATHWGHKERNPRSIEKQSFMRSNMKDVTVLRNVWIVWRIKKRTVYYAVFLMPFLWLEKNNAVDLLSKNVSELNAFISYATRSS